MSTPEDSTKIDRQDWEDKSIRFMKSRWYGVGGARILPWNEATNPPYRRYLRQLRETRHITREQVAMHLGIHTSDVFAYEHGSNTTPYTKLLTTEMHRALNLIYSAMRRAKKDAA